ncbi:hypothetical protein NUSPORA_02587 [Nucleospora cyclopteri]
MIFVFTFFNTIKSAESNQFSQLEIEECYEESNLGEDLLRYKQACKSIDDKIEEECEGMLNILLENIKNQTSERQIFINAIKENEKLSKLQVKDIVQKLKNGDPNFETVKNCIINQVEKEKEKAKKNISSAIYEIYSNLNIHKNKVLKDLSQFQNWFNGKKQEMQERYKLKDSECIPKLKKSKTIKHHLLKDSMEKLSLCEQKPEKVIEEKKLEIDSEENQKMFLLKSLCLESKKPDVKSGISENTKSSTKSQTKILEKSTLPRKVKEILPVKEHYDETQKAELTLPEVDQPKTKKRISKISKSDRTWMRDTLYEQLLHLSKNIKSETERQRIIESLIINKELTKNDLALLIYDNKIILELPPDTKRKFIKQALIKTTPDVNIKCHPIPSFKWNFFCSFVSNHIQKQTYAFELNYFDYKKEYYNITHILSPHLVFNEKIGNVKLHHLILDNEYKNNPQFNIQNNKTYSYVTCQDWSTSPELIKEECKLLLHNVLYFIYTAYYFVEKIYFVPTANMWGHNPIEAIHFENKNANLIYLPKFAVILDQNTFKQLKCINLYNNST